MGNDKKKKELSIRSLFAKKPWPKPKKAKDFKSKKKVKSLKAKKKQKGKK